MRQQQSGVRGRGRNEREVGPTIARRARRPARRRGGATPRRRPPCLQLLERRGPVSVWLVDGAYVRENIDEEFSNFGHHYSCSAIPQDEVWLEQGAVPAEQRFFPHQAAVEREVMAQGKGFRTARHGTEPQQ